MHTTHLGVGLFTNGSATRVLLDANFCPGNRKEQCLQNLWQKFRRWRAQHKIYTSMPRFRHYLLKEDGQHVFYHTKAWHGRILTVFLTDQLQLASSQSQDRNLALVADCVWHLAETYHAVEHAPRFLSGPDPWRRKVPDNINFCIFFNLFFKIIWVQNLILIFYELRHFRIYRKLYGFGIWAWPTLPATTRWQKAPARRTRFLLIINIYIYVYTTLYMYLFNLVYHA